MGYLIELTPDDNATFLVTCPALPELTTFATTHAEAPLRARDAIEEALANRIADREEIPAPSTSPEHRAPVRPDAGQGRAVPRHAFDRVSAPELADRLGVRASAIERMLDLNQRTGLPKIEAAFRALGRRLGIEVSPAA